MKILTSDQLRLADEITIKNERITSVDLMERAASRCADWIMEKYDRKKEIIVFCGMGNNGGDGLVISRKLLKERFNVKTFIVRYSDKKSEELKVNEQRFDEFSGKFKKIIDSVENLPTIKEDALVIDALIGSGLNKVLSGLVAETVKWINESDAEIISIDLPSGLPANFMKNTDQNSQVIKATYTLSFELPKQAFFIETSAIYVGKWILIPIGLDKAYLDQVETDYFLITKEMAGAIFRQRTRFASKWDYGHGLLVAGSYGKMGASVLAGLAAIRTGIGLLTVHAPGCGLNILQTSVPEAMVIPDEDDKQIASYVKIEQYTCVGIGPGIGRSEKTKNVLKLIIQNAVNPIIIDADALNIISDNKTWLSFLPNGSILTPHIREFCRLIGENVKGSMVYSKQIELSVKHNIYVVLKGAISSISTPSGQIYFNITGNPGMAGAGSGDVLTGMLTALLAQGYTPLQTSILGTYLHGLSGDFAASEKGCAGMIARDIINNIPKALMGAEK